MPNLDAVIIELPGDCLAPIVEIKEIPEGKAAGQNYLLMFIVLQTCDRKSTDWHPDNYYIRSPWLLVVDLKDRPQRLHFSLPLMVVCLGFPKQPFLLTDITFWLNRDHFHTSLDKSWRSWCSSPHLPLQLLKSWLNQLPTLWWGFLVLSSDLSSKVFIF